MIIAIWLILSGLLFGSEIVDAIKRNPFASVRCAIDFFVGVMKGSSLSGVFAAVLILPENSYIIGKKRKQPQKTMMDLRCRRQRWPTYLL